MRNRLVPFVCLFIAPAAALTGAACSSETTTPVDGLAPPPDGAGVQVAMSATLAPGEENTWCQYVILPNDATVDVDRFEHLYSPGSHHLLLFPTRLAAADVTGDLAPFECDTRGDLATTGIAYAAQVPEGELAFPTGVGLRLPAASVLLMQVHYLNTTDEPLVADAKINLWYATTTITQEVGLLFLYDWAIHIPAGQTASARMRCGIPQDVTLLYGMSHMHKRGVGYQADLLDAAGAPVRTLFQTDRWEGIDPAVYAPAIQITAGQSIDFRCDFQNDESFDVIQGPSASTNEMCMFIGAYYPRLDFAAENCFLPGSGPIFDGTTTCAETLTCVQSAASDVAFQECLQQTCPASSTAVDDVAISMQLGHPGADGLTAGQAATCD
jgi:hypothetical protein